MNAQNSILLCNFDDVPAVSFGHDNPSQVAALGLVDVTDGGDTGASGQALSVGVYGGNMGGSAFRVNFNTTFDPRDYIGMSWDAQINGDYDIPWVLELNQNGGWQNGITIADWDTQPETYGGYEWYHVEFPFDIISAVTNFKIYGYDWDPALFSTIGGLKNDDPSNWPENPDFPVDQYSGIQIIPAGWMGLPDFTINLDNFRLHRETWDIDDATGIKSQNIVQVFAIYADRNGNIKTTDNAGAVSLKVFNTAGQLMGEGMNQVPVGVKGLYIVKATKGNSVYTGKVLVK